MSIEAMKQALEFVEYHSKYWNGTGTHPQEIGTSLRQAIAVAEKQKPVAWMRKGEDCTDCITWFRTEDNTVPLYEGEAPKREPLTHEQIGELKGGYQSGRIGSFVKLIRAIEAAHGIKGEV